MKLVILAAVLAVCEAGYGGFGLGSFGAFSRGSSNVPSGGYTNDAQGVVVDAVAPGTRTSGLELTGLGGPRTSYGSADSKVGDAAFGVGGAAVKAPLFGLGGNGDAATRVASGFGSTVGKEGNTGGLGISVSTPGIDSVNAVHEDDNSSQRLIEQSQGAIYEYNKPVESLTISKDTIQSGVKPFGSSQTTGSSLSQTQLDIAHGSQFGQKPQATGAISSFGSSASKEGNTGGLGVSVGTPGIDSAHAGYEEDKVYALRFANSLGLKKYSDGFESDNGISVGAKGVSTDGIKANGGYSLEKNAKEEAAGIVDDGTYDAQKYKAEVDYTSNDGEASGGQFVNKATKFNSATQNKKPYQQLSETGGNQLNTQQDNVYEYNNPTTSLSSADHVISGQVSSETESSQTLFGPQSSLNKPSQIQYSQKPFGSSQPGSKLQQTGTSSSQGLTEQYQGTIYEYNKPTEILTSSKDTTSSGFQFGSSASGTQLGQNVGSVTTTTPQITQPFGSQSTQSSLQTIQSGVKPFVSSQTTGSSLSQTQLGSTYGSQLGLKPQAIGTISDTKITIEEKPAVVSQTSTTFKNTQFLSFNEKSQSGQSSSFSSNDESKGQSGLTTQFGVKPDGSSLNTGSSFSQTKFGSTFGSQNGQKAQVDVGTIATVIPHVIPISQYGKKPFGTQSTSGSFQQSQYHVSSTGSQFDQKPQITGTTVFGQTPTGSSQTSFDYTTNQFGSSQSGLSLSEKPQSSLGGTFPTSGASKGESGQTVQFGVKPFGSSQTTGSSFSQTQVSSTSGSLFGQEPQATGSLSQTPTTFGQKPVSVSQTSSTYEKTQFGSLSGSLLNKKSQASQSSSFSSNYASKGQSGPTTQFGVKPFGSSLNTGSSFSQTKFGSTFGSQNGQKSQENIGTISTTIPYVTPIAQYGKKPFGAQSSSGSFQQSQYHVSSTGSQFDQKPQITGTTAFGQTPTGSSQTGFDYTTNQFGSSQSGLSLGEKPQSSLGGTFPTSGASKGESGQTVQFGVKPFGSSQTTGSSFSQTQVSSTSGSLFGQEPQATGSISQTPTTFGQKPVGVSQTSSTYENTQFGSLSGSLLNKKSQASQSSSFSSNDASKGQSGLTTQFGVKPFGSSLNTGSSFSQNKFSSSFGSQNGQTSQEDIGKIPTTIPYVTPISQYGKKPFGAHSSSGSFQQSQYHVSSTGSQFDQKPQITGTTAFGQTPTGSSQTGFDYTTNQFGSSQSGLSLSEKPQSSLGGTFPTSGASKGESGQTVQFGVKPFGSSQTTGSSFSQTQVSSTSGSLFGQEPQATGSISQTPTTFGQKPVGVSQTSSTYENTQFGSLSGSLLNKKSQASQSSSFSSNDASKGQSGLTTQFGVKPFGSSLNTGSSFSQNKFSSSFGSQNGQTSQEDIGKISTTIPYVTPISQYGKKPFGAQSSSGSFQQSQYHVSSTGSQFDQKPQITGTTAFGQTPTGSSQTGFDYTTNQFGSSQSGLSPGEKPQSSLGGTFPTSGASKGESGQTVQFGVKPFGSSQKTGSSFSQTQVSSTSGSLFGQEPQATGSLSQTPTTFGQKPVSVSQTSSTYEKTQFGSLSGSLLNKKSQVSQSSSFSSNDASKGQSGLTTQFGVKPFGSSLNIPSSFSQTKFGSTFGFQNGQTSQEDIGKISTAIPYVTPISQYGKKPFGAQSTSGSFQQSQYHVSSTGSQFDQKPQITGTTAFGQTPTGSSQTGFDYPTNQFGSSQSGLSLSEKPQSTLGGTFPTSGASKVESGQSVQFGAKPFGSSQTTVSSFSQTQFGGTSGSLLGQKPQTTGSLSQTTSTFGQKPVSISQSSSTYEKTQFGSLSDSSFNEKSQTSQSSQSGLMTQFGVKPFGNSLNTGSSFSQTQFGSTSAAQNDQKSQLGVGTVSTITPQVTPISQYNNKPFGIQSTQNSFQQSQYSLSGSQFGQNPQKQGSSLFSNAASKGQSELTTQFGAKPFGSSLTTGSSSTQTQFGSTFGSQYDKKPIDSLSYQDLPRGPQNQGSFSGIETSKVQTSHLSSSNVQPIGGLLSQVIEQQKKERKPGPSIVQEPLGSFHSSLHSERSQSTLGSSFTSSSTSEVESAENIKFGVKPFRGPEDFYVSHRDPPRFDEKTGYHY